MAGTKVIIATETQRGKGASYQQSTGSPRGARTVESETLRQDMSPDMSPRSHGENLKSELAKARTSCFYCRDFEITEVGEPTEKRAEPEVSGELSAISFSSIGRRLLFGGLSGMGSAESSRPARKRRTSSTETREHKVIIGDLGKSWRGVTRWFRVLGVQERFHR